MAKFWWAYKHLDGSIHIKRFLGAGKDKQEAEKDPYVQDMWGPFEAQSFEDAQAEAEQVLGEEL